jgi:hypothetical protein
MREEQFLALLAILLGVQDTHGDPVPPDYASYLPEVYELLHAARVEVAHQHE